MRPARVLPALSVLVAAGLLAGCSGDGAGGSATASRTSDVSASAPETTAPPSPSAAPASPAPTAAPTAAAASGPPSDQRRFAKVTRITGKLTPKSVDAAPDGTVVAQNMIYTHTVSVYDADKRLVATIPDTVRPSDFGYPQWTSPLTGGPVEAAFSPDGKHLWVSNYKMSGPGFTHPGDDVCSPRQGFDKSFLYRIDTATWKVDGIVLVGAVPKYVAVSPDGATVLISNWCSYDLSVVDTASLKEVARVPIGAYPRGIAVQKDSATAYVAVMGSSNVLAVDLAAARAGTPATRVLSTPGRGPRHLNLSPDGTTLYATLNSVGLVAKIDVATGRVLGRVATGTAPRSAALSPDGTALFVVNYESDTVSRVRTSDLAVLESVKVDHHPIGITYNPATREVWACSYSGVINVFADKA